MMEEQSKLQRKVEMYRIMEFLNSPSDQQWDETVTNTF